jgi:hypothetical protein
MALEELLRRALQQEFSHASRVDLAALCLHDRSDKGTGGPHLAGADRLNHVFLLRAGRVDGGDERDEGADSLSPSNGRLGRLPLPIPPHDEDHNSRPQ